MIGSLPGGAIAEWLGPYWVIQGATAASAVLNSLCVWVTPLHWGFLFALRFLIGFVAVSIQTSQKPHYNIKWIQGLVYPALQCLIGRWAPPQDRTKFVSCLMGNTLGTCLTWIIVGVVIRQYKWPWG